MKADAFKPQGKEIRVASTGAPESPELGQHFQTQGQPHRVQRAPRTVQQGGDRFVAASQPVQMGAQQQPQGHQPQPAPPVPSAPQQQQGHFQPAPPAQSVQAQLSAQRANTQQQQQQPQPARLNGVDTFAVYIDGTAPDGSALTTDPIPVQFPAGSVLSGMRYERA